MRLAVGTITLVAGLLIALGLTMLHSIGMHHRLGLAFFERQCQWLVVGLIVCVVVALVDYRRMRNLSYLLLAATAVLLVLARTPGVGKLTKGAWRWISVGGISIQPSEFAKVALILAIAAYAHSMVRRMKSPLYGLVIPGSAIGVVLGLVLVGKDLGTTALLATLSTAMLFAAGTRLRHLVPAGLVVASGLLLYLATDEVRRNRVVAFLHPEKFETIAYQTEQSKVAIGSGGATGRGLGNGLHKSGFVPDQHTDFIFSVIGEELGLRITLPIVLAYVVFFVASLRIARRAPDTFGAMIAFGAGTLIALQAAMNVAVTTGSIPNKGLALPFVSYGGSCLLTMLTLVGLLINVAIRSAREESSEYLPESEDREAPALQNA